MIQITTTNEILLDGQRTGLAVAQDAEKTRVFTRENLIAGLEYAEHKMPHARYALSTTRPASGAAGRDDFERDIRALLGTMP